MAQGADFERGALRDPGRGTGRRRGRSAESLSETREETASRSQSGKPDGRRRIQEGRHGLRSPQRSGETRPVHRGEIDDAGRERPRQPYYRNYAESDERHRYASDAGFSDLGGEDLFSQMFGRSQSRDPNRNGADVHYSLELEFLEAFNGGRRTLSLPDGAPLEMKIPPGTRTGRTLCLRGKGRPGMGTGRPGDALIEIEVRPDETFRLEGDDIHVDLSISLRDAVLGGKVAAPTPSGPVTMTVPKWSSTGAVLRLRGKGLSKGRGESGDEYVTLKMALPDKPDAELEEFMTRWGKTGPDEARQREAVR